MMFRALHAHVRGPMQACNPVTGEARLFEVVPCPDLADFGQIGQLSAAWADYFRACGDWRVEPDPVQPKAGPTGPPEGGQEGDGGGAPAGGRGAPPPESVEGGQEASTAGESGGEGNVPSGAVPAGEDAPPSPEGGEVEAGDAEAGARGRNGARKGR